MTLVLASVPTACRKPASPETDKPEITVQAEHPALGDLTEQMEADAVLAPIAQAAILPRISAPVKTFLVQRGSLVRAGQLVATLEDKDLQAAAIDNSGAYTAARGAFRLATGSTVPEEQTRARLDLTQAKATLDLDNTILKSRQQLFAQGAIPGRDVDTAKATAQQAEAAYDIARQRLSAQTSTGTTAAVDSAKGTLESARGKYLGAEAQLSYTQIRTPISGVVTERPLFAGETATPGTPLLTVMDTSSMLAKLHIAQVQAQQLRPGAPATITVPGLTNPVPAQVSLISPALDPGSTTVEVWLKAANPARTLKAGTPVHVTLQGRTLHRTLLVPAEAIQRSTEGPGSVVQVIAPDGTTRKRDVTVGVTTKDSAQILTGLSPADLVITSGAYGLDDGTKVKIGPPEKPGDDKEEKEDKQDKKDAE